MIDIPSNILNLLKSRQQIGENRPTAVIEFGGQSTATLQDPTEWTTWRVFTSDDRGYGGICETSDGRAVVAFTRAVDRSVQVAFASNIRSVLDGSETFAVGGATVLASYDTNQPKCSINLVDGRLRIAVNYYNATTGLWAAEYWCDSDGKGADFAKVSDISTDLTSYADHRPPSLIKRLGNGNLIVHLPYGYAGYRDGTLAFYSDNDGFSWNAGIGFNPGLVDYLMHEQSRNPFPIGDSNYLTVWTASNSGGSALLWTASGTGIQGYDWLGDWGIWNGYPPIGNNTPHSGGWESVGDKVYMINNSKVLEYIGGEVSVEGLITAENYALVKAFSSISGQRFLLATNNALILQSCDSNVIGGAGTAVISQALRPKQVTVSRSKGSASQLSVQFENTGGKYAPDPAGAWHHIIWPNNTVAAKLGYGDYLPQVFSGLADDVDMETPPQMISVTARDPSKKVLDQMCQWTWDGVTYYDGAWASQDPEGIFVALATMAGFAEADIVYDMTGITIPEFKFNQQTYADLIQKLAEMSGCEWYCDEQGKIYFKLVTYPEATPAYSFVAGVDIFSLGYKISDAEIYRDVVVTAQGPQDESGDSETISVRAEWSAADYYGLPPHKTLHVTASDIVQDEAGCLEIANRMLLAMTTKPRQVQFVAVGIPNLQIGDCIQVTEASSTISEIYRVYDFEHQYDAEGSPVFATAIKCYWYAHG